MQVTGHKRKRKRGNDQSLLGNYEIIKECNRPTAPLLELILKKTFKKRHYQVLCICPAYHHSLVSKYEQFV
jgi:hypothetical protein